MEQGLFTKLPSEMTIEILSRLPVGAVRSCKHVCKTWLNLLKTEEFAKSHLSKSVPTGIVIKDYLFCVLMELEEEVIDHAHREPLSIPLHLKMTLLTGFSVGPEGRILCSVNGLLLLCDMNTSRNCNFVSICNPITREYIELHYPKGHGSGWEVAIYGFGISKLTGQYKLVRVSHDRVIDECGKMWMSSTPDAKVYTLGTGTWRNAANCAPPFVVSWNTGGVLVNGKIHWLVLDQDGCPWIYSFDLDTELFSSFASAPPSPAGCNGFALSALGDCLCLSDSSSREIVIWLMKDYGVVTSWTKEFVIRHVQITSAVDVYTTLHPIKLLKGGEILMLRLGVTLFYYCRKENTVWRVHSLLPAFSADLHIPSFLSLRRFEMESVKSF